ncbi:MAG: ribonuclease E [Arsenophonus sp.]|nr:MAG: ribonuclease E [Arsenophonus sp.]
MKRMLINVTKEEELRVALVDGKKLYDLDIENFRHEQKKSNIYKGKITRIESSLEAAFVDYGSEKHGFLPIKEISSEYFPNNYSYNNRPNIKNILKEGQEILIQINKEERGQKGAALTTFITLAGTYLVLMPNNPRVGGISRRIEGEDRIELKEALSSLQVPNGMGLIIRTAGLGKTKETLQQDLKYRLNHWEAIKKASKNRTAPFLIHQESNVITRAFRDYLRPDIEEILIDNYKIVTMAKYHVNSIGQKNFFKKIKYYTGSTPLFSYYQIESQIESIFQREVRLPSGGVLVIDSTEALTSIDINSSRSTKGIDIEETAFNTNLEAVTEIARQLRLRDLGGLIVIDFIDMHFIKHQREIENKLREITRQDRARIQITKISRFGLLELSRQRLSSSLGESICHICPRCNGIGRIRNNESLSLSILRLIKEEFLKENTHAIHVIVPTKIAIYLLNEKRKSINEIESLKDNIQIIVVANDKMQTPHFHILRIKKGEVISTFSYYLAKYHENRIKKTIEKKNNENKIREKPILSNFLFHSQKRKKNIFSILSFQKIKNIVNKKILIFKKIKKKIILIFQKILSNNKKSSILNSFYIFLKNVYFIFQLKLIFFLKKIFVFKTRFPIKNKINFFKKKKNQIKNKKIINYKKEKNEDACFSKKKKIDNKKNIKLLLNNKKVNPYFFLEKNSFKKKKIDNKKNKNNIIDYKRKEYFKKNIRNSNNFTKTQNVSQRFRKSSRYLKDNYKKKQTFIGQKNKIKIVL